MNETTCDAREGRSLLSLLWPDCERDWREMRDDHHDDDFERAVDLRLCERRGHSGAVVSGGERWREAGSGGERWRAAASGGERW
eukprot:5722136-Prymnesium_polylepis.1